MHMSRRSLDSAIDRIRSLTDDKFAEQWAGPLRAVESMKRGVKLLNKITKASDKEALGDHLAEAFFAVVFAGLGFDVQFYPAHKSERGPDLRVARGPVGFAVEVAHIREKPLDPIEEQCLEETGHFQRTLDPAKHIRKVYDVALDKLSQVHQRSCIVAIWNGWTDLTRTDAEIAARIIRNEADRGIRRLPNGGVFIVYASRFRRTDTGQELFCYDLCSSTALIRELSEAKVDQLMKRATNDRKPGTV